MSNQRQRKTRGGGIPPELMNVEFNPNDPQALMDADDDDPDDGIGDLPLNNINNTNNRMMNGNNGGGAGGGGGGNYNMYGQQQRAYTYKDRPGSLRGDGYGGGGKSRYNPITNPATALAVQSHNYEPDESEVWRAYVAQVHFSNRGQWWTTGKKRALKRWILTFAVGVVQAVVATSCNFASRSMTSRKYDYIYELLNPSLVESTTGGLSSNVVADDDFVAAGDDTANGSYYSKKYGNDENADGADIWKAFWNFCLIQVLLCAVASMFVYIGKYTKIKGTL